MVTKQEALTANYFADSAGRRWRRNGATKVWKTRPDEFRVPVKHGLYSYGYITHTNAQFFEVNNDY